MEAMKLAHVEEKFDVFLLSPHKSTSVSLATEVKATHLDSFGRSHNEILDNRLERDQTQCACHGARARVDWQ